MTSIASAGIPRRNAIRLGPQVGLAFAGALAVCLFGFFTYIVANSQSESRRQAERRFDGQASLAAALTASIFTTSSSGSQAAAAKAFGAKEISRGDAAAVAKAGKLAYVTVLDGNGHLLATSSPGIPTPGGPAVRSALAGHPKLGDVQGNVLVWALPFDTQYGRRVEVEAFPGAPIAAFLDSYLNKARSENSGVAFVLDGRNRTVARAGGSAKFGDLPKATGLVTALASKTRGTYSYNGTKRYFSSYPITGSTWRLVLAVPTSQLYPALAGSRSWMLYLVLGAFAVASAFSLLMFRRAVVSGSRLRQTNAELEDRVAERTAAAEERAAELSRSNEELERFSAVASHDLQEPLRKIRMFGDRLQERLGEGISTEATEDLSRMRNAAERMQRLIGDLLDYSRVTHRGRAFERVDMVELTREVWSDLEARVVELDATVDIGDLPTIDADPTQMRQLLQNLLGNALKFHREDEPPRVRVSGGVIPGRRPRFAREAGLSDRCVITVEDNGIGFDAHHAERIFTAFERLHGRSAYDGTGIGLSIARKIAWRHGGEIVAQSEPGQGSTFTVTLPVSHANGSNGNGGSA